MTIAVRRQACPFCGAPLFPRYQGVADRLETSREPFAISECGECGSGVLNPAPVGDVSAFYPEHYLSAAGGATGGAGFDLERWYRYNQYDFDFGLLERSTGQRLAQVSSYLDLGCGSGERVAYVSGHGCPRSVGVDKFDFAKDTVRPGIEVVNSEIVDFRPAKPFSVVSLFHVLEHLEEPAAILAHARDRLLDRDGHLVIQVPNYGTLERRWFGSRWFGLDAPRHYWHFTADGLGRLLGAQGFSVRAVYQRNAALHPVSLAASLYRDADPQRIWVGSGGPTRRRVLMLVWAALTALSIPVAIAESGLGRGSMLTVIAAPR